jgi:hypothetical protein
VIYSYAIPSSIVAPEQTATVEIKVEDNDGRRDLFQAQLNGGAIADVGTVNVRGNATFTIYIDGVEKHSETR